MRRHPFPLAAALALTTSLAAQAAGKPQPRPANQHAIVYQAKARKVWTNDDVPELRARSVISIVGQEPEQAPSSEQAAPPAEPSYPVYDSRLDDPEWYAKTAAELQVELDQRQAELQQQQQALALAKERVTQPGINMDEPSIAVTPDAALALLQARVQQVQDQLDELADLARKHDIAPGDLRG